MNAPLYTLEILRLAASLPGPVALKRIDGRGEARSPTCGSVVVAEVTLDRRGRIEGLSLAVEACAFGQASATIVAQQSPGHDHAELAATLEQLAEWLSGRRDSPPAWPGFETLAPARTRKSRHGAILLPLRALLAAMERGDQ